jgi:hypothetical protein
MSLDSDPAVEVRASVFSSQSRQPASLFQGPSLQQYLSILPHLTSITESAPTLFELFCRQEPQFCSDVLGLHSMLLQSCDTLLSSQICTAVQQSVAVCCHVLRALFTTPSSLTRELSEELIASMLLLPTRPSSSFVDPVSSSMSSAANFVASTTTLHIISILFAGRSRVIESSLVGTKTAQPASLVPSAPEKHEKPLSRIFSSLDDLNGQEGSNIASTDANELSTSKGNTAASSVQPLGTGFGAQDSLLITETTIFLKDAHENEERKAYAKSLKDLVMQIVRVIDQQGDFLKLR